MPVWFAVTALWLAVGEHGRSRGNTSGRAKTAFAISSVVYPIGAFQAGLFTFFGLFEAQGAGLDAHAVSQAIGFSVIGGAFGPMAAYLLDRRVGVGPPIAGSVPIQGSALILLLMTHYDPWLFLVYISVLQAEWTFLCCYLHVALIDAAPELTAASVPITALSSATGAYGAGVMIEDYGNWGLLIGAFIMLVPTCPWLSLSFTPRNSDRKASIERSWLQKALSI